MDVTHRLVHGISGWRLDLEFGILGTASQTSPFILDKMQVGVLGNMHLCRVVPLGYHHIRSSHVYHNNNHYIHYNIRDSPPILQQVMSPG
jgi:hypothetical protein